MNTAKWAVMLVLGTMLSIGIHPAAGLASPILGSAQNFAVLGGSTVTNTGSTTITGDVGVSPDSAITGFFPPGVVIGTIHTTDAVAALAQSDALSAYIALAGLLPGATLPGTLGTQTLFAGIYNFTGGAAVLTGALTLDAQGNPNAQFVFQIGSTLTTATSSSVQVINNGSDDGVFWQVGSSATLGTGTAFEGNILALTSITLTTGATILDGRALALNGAVTLDTNTINRTSAVPVPGALLLLGSGLGALVGFGRRFLKA